MEISKNVMDTMLDLVSIPSISGTDSENLAAKRIFDIISDYPYFKENPNNLKTVDIPNDPFQRSFVSALFTSSKKSNKTIILTGHFDVVGIDEFGHLKELAFKPIEFTQRVHELNLNEEALKDLQSNDYIFGRGTADMKYGLALHMELLRVISSRDDITGNILFLAVPGEESNSEGMLAAAPYLSYLQENEKLDFSALLLSECCMPKVPGDTNKYVYMGTVGKIMPLFFFVGKETHVCEPFNGISPNLLASEVNRLFEFNTDFSDIEGDEISPPPLCLKQTDLKDLYSVQIPLYAAAYYNLLTLNSDVNTLILSLKNLCTNAFQNTLEIINTNRKSYEIKSKTKSSMDNIEPCVITYSELYQKTKKIYGDDLDEYLDKRVNEWIEKKFDNQSIAINLIKETYEKYPYKKPMIIIGFAPPYYPDKHLNITNSKDLNLINAVDGAIKLANDKYNEKIYKINSFMGICDLSYTGLSNSSDIEKTSSNMLSSFNYSLPVESLKKIDIPGIVIGGLGKDFHKYTERLNLSYSLNVVPNLYEHIIYQILK